MVTAGQRAELIGGAERLFALYVDIEQALRDRELERVPGLVKEADQLRCRLDELKSQIAEQVTCVGSA